MAPPEVGRKASTASFERSTERSTSPPLRRRLDPVLMDAFAAGMSTARSSPGVARRALGAIENTEMEVDMEEQLEALDWQRVEDEAIGQAALLQLRAGAAQQHVARCGIRTLV